MYLTAILYQLALSSGFLTVYTLQKLPSAALNHRRRLSSTIFIELERLINSEGPRSTGCNTVALLKNLVHAQTGLPRNVYLKIKQNPYSLSLPEHPFAICGPDLGSGATDFWSGASCRTLFGTVVSYHPVPRPEWLAGPSRDTWIRTR